MNKKGGGVTEAISNLKFQIASPKVKFGREDHPHGWQSCSSISNKVF